MKNKKDVTEVEHGTKDQSNIEDIPMEFIPNAGGCIVTKSVIERKTAIKWVYREESIRQEDNGWRIFGENDTQEYIDDNENLLICDYNTLIEIEPIMSYVYPMPIGANLELIKDNTGVYFLNHENGQQIREKVKSPIQIAFENNLKFISKAELETEEVERAFKNKENIHIFELGEVSFPTGNVIVSDPLCYLQDYKSITVLKENIPAGKYKILLSIMDSAIAGRRIVGAKCKITEKIAHSYQLAEALKYVNNPEENLDKKPAMSGFPVETGTGGFCDEAAAISYWKFLDQWYSKNPDKNIYDDYFSEYYQESYEKYPNEQRPGGDFINWENPMDQSQLSFFSSGLGDGFYCPYWGLDESGSICELVVMFMNPELF